MNIEQLSEQYWFHGGSLKTFHLDIQANRVKIEVDVKRIKTNREPGPLNENELTPCTLLLQFDDLLEVSLFDKFPTQGYYLNGCMANHHDLGVEISFNVHSSSSVYENDNWIIKAKQMEWKEV